MPPKRALLKRKSLVEEWYNPPAAKNTSLVPKQSSQQNLWSDVLSPSTLKEVAVHHEKIRELSEVLSAVKSNGKGIILLTGPPGSAKSTCFSAVCRELALASTCCRYEDEDETSGTDELERFEDFLFRSARYTDVRTSSKYSSSDETKSLKMRVVLIEHLPMGICDQVVRFHSHLRSFYFRVLISTVLVFILTKSNSPTLASSSTSEFDNATINRLFPPHIKEELSILQVDFNPIAPSILTRALNRIIKLAESQFGLLPPPRTFIQKLVSSSSGDLRLAINNLQFMLVEANNNASGNAKINSNVSLNNPAMEFYERDSSILLFHALGKILHGKRVEPTATCNSWLPDNLRHWRRLPLSFVPESVLDQCGVSGEEILAWIHENYTQFFTNLAALEWISSSISFADAQLTGGMNWRLGLSPAADRNSETSSSANVNLLSFASASDNYSAIFVSRAVLLVPRQHPTGAGPGFKALRAPKSRKTPLLNHIKGNLSDWCASLPIGPDLAACHVQRSVICDLRQTLLERLPLELQLTTSGIWNKVAADEIVSLCKFGASNSTTATVQSKSHPFRPPLRPINNESSVDFYCSSADAAEGAAVNIDEDFSDSESHL